MIRNKLLLQGEPTYVLAPDIELTQNIVTKPDKENGKEGPFNCDGCGKALNSEYYILIGIPPSQLIVASFPCKSSDNENHSVERHMSDIRFMLSKLNTSDSIKDEYQWIFSEQNIASSKTRVCGIVLLNMNYHLFGNLMIIADLCLLIMWFLQLKNINGVILPLIQPCQIMKDISFLYPIEVIYIMLDQHSVRGDGLLMRIVISKCILVLLQNLYVLRFFQIMIWKTRVRC